jgi:alpha-galactosidase
MTRRGGGPWRWAPAALLAGLVGCSTPIPASPTPAVSARAQLASPASATPVHGYVPPGRGLALTPPMGWNGYNRFGRNVSAALIEAEARMLVASGMKAAGYTYVNLDGGWNVLRRSAAGILVPNPELFPHGIRPVAHYLHSLGLRFGIYASAGLRNCAGTSAGSFGHYRQDAATFAAWGVDYVKLDWCWIPFRRYPGLTHPQVSELLAVQMGRALDATGRRILYDINNTNWRLDHTWSWARPLANMWRTTSDIRTGYMSMVEHFTANVSHFRRAGPGGWNDPDMLEVGNPGMSLNEQRTEFSLWSEMAAPLIAGNDLTTMPAAVGSILTNRAVIAVDQDRLGRQGYVVSHRDGQWVLTKQLSGGARAVVLFNESGSAAIISASAAELGLPAAAAYTLRDLWSGALTWSTGTVRARVPAHGVVMYRVSAGTAR